MRTGGLASIAGWVRARALALDPGTPIEDMNRTEQIIKWLFDESITIEEIDEMDNKNIEWYRQPDVPEEGMACGECGAMDIAISVMTSVSPNGKDRQGQMEEMFDEADYDEAYCYVCEDYSKGKDIVYIRGEEMIGTMVKRIARDDEEEKGQVGLVVGVGKILIREEDRHYIPEGYMAGHYEVVWAGSEEKKKMNERRSIGESYRITWMNKTEEVA